MIPADGDRRFTSAMTRHRLAAAARRERRRARRGRPPPPARARAARGSAPGRRPRVVVEDLVEGNGHLALRPVFGYSNSGSVRSTAVSRGAMRMPLTKRQSEILTYLQRPHPGQRLCAELRGDRGAVRLPVARHGARASHQPRAQGLHPPLLQREPLHRGAARRAAPRPRPRSRCSARWRPALPIESLMHEETIAVPDQMLPRRGPNYALKVQGTSMIDEHIMDGDFVVVHGKQRRRERRNGHRAGQRQRGHGQEVLSRAGRMDPPAAGQHHHAAPCASRSATC